MAKKQDFNKQFALLEKITQELESGSLDLDQSLARFEQGLKIAQELKKQLNKTANRIKELKTNNA